MSGAELDRRISNAVTQLEALRGLSGAREDFLLIATVQNLKRLAQHSTIRARTVTGYGHC